METQRWQEREREKGNRKKKALPAPSLGAPALFSIPIRRVECDTVDLGCFYFRFPDLFFPCALCESSLFITLFLLNILQSLIKKSRNDLYEKKKAVYTTEITPMSHFRHFCTCFPRF